VDTFTEEAGLLEIPLTILFSYMNVPAKNPAHNTEIIMPVINKAAPTIKIM
jgi:hypothetical protein